MGYVRMWKEKPTIFQNIFFRKRVHRITRPAAVQEELEDVASVIRGAEKPLLIVGGGVRFSEAGRSCGKIL